MELGTSDADDSYDEENGHLHLWCLLPLEEYLPLEQHFAQSFILSYI